MVMSERLRSQLLYWLVLLSGLLIGFGLAMGQSSAESAPTDPQALLLTPTPTRTYTPTITPACGLAWRRVNSPNGAGYNELNGVAAVSTNDVWAVGYTVVNSVGYTLIEHWDGMQWSIVPSPNVPGTSNYLYGVAATSASDVWAVGGIGLFGGNDKDTLILHWDGALWSIVPSPNPDPDVNELRGVAVAATGDAWAVGVSGVYPNQRSLILHWDGIQWNNVILPNIVGREHLLYGVSALAANDVWAVGTHFITTSNLYQTLTLHWDGSVWSVVPSPNGSGYNSLRAVEAISANDAWATGDYGSGPISMHWDGSTWSLVPISGFYAYTGLTATASNEVWAIGFGYGQTGSQIARWNGFQWTLQQNIHGSYLEAVAALAPHDVWAVGRMYEGGNFIGHYSDPCTTSTPTPTGTPTTAAATPTRPPPTPTTGCCPSSNVSITGTSSCVAPATYDYNLYVHNQCSRTICGPTNLIFQVAQTPNGPMWDTLNLQSGPNLCVPSGGSGMVNGTFYQSVIPPGRHWYRVQLQFTWVDCIGNQSQIGATTPRPLPPRDYVVSSSPGATIVPATTYVPGSTCDSCTVNIPLPFTYAFYGDPPGYTSVNVSNKGNLQFASNNSSGQNQCLPTNMLNDSILTYWDDLNTNINDTMGIYTRVDGSTPNRIFTIEWRAGQVANDATFNFEVRLYEGQPKIEMIYGQVTPRGFGATIGVQQDQGTLYTQYSCNTQSIQPGTRLTFEQWVCSVVGSR